MNLSIEEVEKGLDTFGASHVVVGHTIQKKVSKKYDGRVIGIDVQHPKDYHKNWPNRETEGLLIENKAHFRVFNDGEKKGI